MEPREQAVGPGAPRHIDQVIGVVLTTGRESNAAARGKTHVFRPPVLILGTKQNVAEAVVLEVAEPLEAEARDSGQTCGE